MTAAGSPTGWRAAGLVAAAAAGLGAATATAALLDRLDRQRWAVRELADRIARVAAAQQELLTAVADSRQALTRRQRDATAEVEALVQLFRAVEPRAPMPSSGHWALNPTDLLELWYAIQLHRPALVLELGSGASTVWIGYALERHHRGRLVSVDHDHGYAERTRAQLRRHGLTGVAEVREAPLRPLRVAGEVYRWYDPAVFDDLAGVDLLLVDGPPGDTGPHARLPALPVLEERLSPEAVVVLDDADRSDEQEIVQRWTGTVHTLARQPGTLGHLAVLTYTRADPPTTTTTRTDQGSDDA